MFTKNAGKPFAKLNFEEFTGQAEVMVWSEVFVANGSNEVIQSICLAFGGNDRSALIFEPTYAMHSQIAKITGTRVRGVSFFEGFI